MLFSGVLALFGAEWKWNNVNAGGVSSVETENPTGFDDVFVRKPMASSDTGEIGIGANAGNVSTFTAWEAYAPSGLVEILTDSITPGVAQRNSWSILEQRLTTKYPVWSNENMLAISNNQKVDDPPVVLLDNSSGGVVLVELANLFDAELSGMANVDVPPSFKYNGVPQDLVAVETSNSDFAYGQVGELAYNTNGSKTIRGLFKEEGLYEFEIKVRTISVLNPVIQNRTIKFSFYIAQQYNYYTVIEGATDTFPKFPDSARADGSAEVYNYSYGSDYPTVIYDTERYNTTVNNEKVGEKFRIDPDTNAPSSVKEYTFQDIGEYTMTTQLVFPYKSADGKTTLVPITGYTEYVSQLNIFGFQAYYGGWHDLEFYEGMHPFFDAEDKEPEKDSNITPLLPPQSEDEEEETVMALPDIPSTLSAAANISRNLATALSGQSVILPQRTKDRKSVV
jgi:hypothetical protein